MATIQDQSPRLAVLIDADNASSQIVSGLFTEVAKIGEASVRRIYGDFSGTKLKAWADVLSQFAIIPQQNFALTSGKNASDIALVIDAMDLLASDRFEAFCLVSSDSDFTRLAARIREQGVDVYGFGEKKTPESFRKACKRFIFTENLMQDAGADCAKTRPDTTTAVDPMPIIEKAIETLEDTDGWYPLSTLGSSISKLYPDFDPRSYGCPKLVSLIERSGAFEVRRQSLSVYIKPKT